MEIVINIINKLDVNFVALFLVILIGASLLLIGNGIQKGDILIKQNTIIFWTGLFVIVSGISLTIYIIIKPAQIISEPKYINTWGWDHEVGKPVIHQQFPVKTQSV